METFYYESSIGQQRHLVNTGPEKLLYNYLLCSTATKELNQPHVYQLVQTKVTKWKMTASCLHSVSQLFTAAGGRSLNCRLDFQHLGINPVIFHSCGTCDCPLVENLVKLTTCSGKIDHQKWKWSNLSRDQVSTFSKYQDKMNKVSPMMSKDTKESYSPRHQPGKPCSSHIWLLI